MATGPKLKSKTQKEQVLAVIAKLDRRGHTQHEIVALMKRECKIQLSQAMISTYLKQIRERYKEEHRAEYGEMLAERLAQFREVRAEAWAAWERSKNDAERTTEEKALRTEYSKIKDGAGRFVPKGERLKLIKQVLMREGRLPADRYLAIVVDCLVQECKMLGLTGGDTNFNFNMPERAGIDWDALAAGPPQPAQGEVIGVPHHDVIDVEVKMLPPHGVNGKQG